MDIRSTVIIPRFQIFEIDLQFYFTYIYWIRFPTLYIWTNPLLCMYMPDMCERNVLVKQKK
jgi:hypothetical protein